MVKIKSLKNVMIKNRRYKRAIDIRDVSLLPGESLIGKYCRIGRTVEENCSHNYYRGVGKIYFENKIDALMVALAL